MAIGQLENIKNVALDFVTPDPDFSRDEINQRKQKRTTLYSALDELNNTSIGINDEGTDLLLKDLPKKHPYWKTSEGAEQKKLIKKILKSLDGKYETTYQELSFDDDWVNAHRKFYKKETGNNWRGTDSALTEHYFEKYNDFTNSMTMTAYRGLTDNFWFSNFDDDTLKLLSQQYDTFHRTDMTGLGSRNFLNQAADFVLQSGTDPITIGSIYATGGASTLASKAAAPFVMKKLVSDTIAKRASQLTGASVVSGTLGGGIDANLQMVEQRMEGQEELDIDPGEVGTMAAISAAIPPVLAGANVLVSKVTPFIDDVIDVPRQILRTLTSPVKQTLKNTTRGRGAAGFGMLEAEEKAIIRGRTGTTNEDFTKILIDDVINPASASIQQGFGSLKYTNINPASQRKISNLIADFRLNNTLDPNIQTKELDRILNVMYDSKSLDDFVVANKLGLINPDKWPKKFLNMSIPGSMKSNVAGNTWRDLRNEVYDLAQKELRTGTKNTYKKYMQLYDDIKEVQKGNLANKGEVALWNSLNQANSRFNTMLENNSIGQYFTKIKQHKDKASANANKGDILNQNQEIINAQLQSEELLTFILQDKKAYSSLMQFKTALGTVDETTTNVQKAINASNKADIELNAQNAKLGKAQMDIRPNVDQPATANSYNQIIGTIKASLGDYLDEQAVKAAGTTDVPYAALDELISRPNGIKLITELFPEQAVFYKGLESLKKTLQEKVNKKAGQSVIINMTVARMATDLGSSAAGKFGAFAAPVASVPLLQRMRNTLGDARWQRAMAQTIQNNGEIPTWFTKFLQKTNKYSDADITQLQKDWNLLTYGTAVPKNQQNIDEELKDKDGGMKIPFTGYSLKEMYGDSASKMLGQ